jgi:RNA polymerase sigma-70 factor, ECF subfamily
MMQAQHIDDADDGLVRRVRERDERAFAELLARHGGAMLRFARSYTRDAALAEDAVQDAWLGFLRGIDRFEGRSSLRTWLFRILINRLRTRLGRDSRLVPFSTLGEDAGADEAAVPADRFLDESHPRWPGHWRTPPASWGESPEERLLAREARAVIDQAVAALPPAQREVITLRDIEGWAAQDVCNVLDISEPNQRVLLHRARSRVRRALETYMTEG